MKTITHHSETYLTRTLIRRNAPHTITRTKSTCRITTELPGGEPVQYVITDSPLKMQDLGFINQVKHAARKSTTAPEGNTASNIHYWQFKDLSEGTYRDIVEVDVNGAYWEIAYRRGVIPKKVYEKGLTVPKRVRLVALGAMATQKRIWEYIPELQKYIAHPPQSEPVLRSYFFDIARELDDIMQSAARFPEVLFYWVDAFFLERSHAANIVQAINDAGLSCKQIELDRVEVKRLKSGRMLAEVYDILNPTPRPFWWGDQKATAEFIIKCVVGTIKAAGL